MCHHKMAGWMDCIQTLVTVIYVWSSWYHESWCEIRNSGHGLSTSSVSHCDILVDQIESVPQMLHASLQGHSFKYTQAERKSNRKLLFSKALPLVMDWEMFVYFFCVFLILKKLQEIVIFTVLCRRYSVR